MSWRDDVRRVDWGTLRGAYGAALGVPAELDALCGGDADALSFIHQGDVYEVTPHVVPYLVSIASDASVDIDTRIHAMQLLLAIASANVPEPAARYNPFTKRVDPPATSRWADLAKWIGATQEALRNETSRFAALAMTQDKRLRALAEAINAELDRAILR